MLYIAHVFQHLSQRGIENVTINNTRRRTRSIIEFCGILQPKQTFKTTNQPFVNLVKQLSYTVHLVVHLISGFGWLFVLTELHKFQLFFHKLNSVNLLILIVSQ